MHGGYHSAQIKLWNATYPYNISTTLSCDDRGYKITNLGMDLWPLVKLLDTNKVFVLQHLCRFQIAVFKP